MRLHRDMQYVDSNVFIYPVIYRSDEQEKAKKAREMLLKIENGELSAYTSMLTWDEVVWVVSKTLGRGDGALQGRKLLGFPNLNFIDVDEGVVTSAQALIERYKLSPRDSVHLASAITRKIRNIISDDADFDEVKEITRTPFV